MTRRDNSHPPVLMPTGSAVRARARELATEVDDRAGVLDVKRPEAEATVEADGPEIAGDHGHVHPLGARSRHRVAESRHQPAAVASALEVRQQVNVQVSRVFRQPRPQQALRPVVQGEHLLVGSDRRTRRDRVAAGQAGNPPVPVGARERGRVRSPDDVADGPMPVVEHEGEVGLQENVRPGKQIGHQVVAIVFASCVPAAVGRPHADVVKRAAVAFVIATDRCVFSVCCHASMMPARHPECMRAGGEG